MSSLAFFERHVEAYLRDLERLVRLETPSGDEACAEGAADFLAAALTPCAQVERVAMPGYGPLLRARRPGTATRVLLLGHYDTVWPRGSWSSLWSASHGQIRGPGIYDMKGGVLFIAWLLRWLEAGGAEHPELEVVLTPDEESGSPSSLGAIESAARRADFVLVLEPATPRGEVKLGRRGAGEFVITIEGRAAHQGAEPERGINAVVEAAHQVVRLLELEDRERGATFGPNVIHGGTVSNAVADHAEVRVDVRAWSERDQAELEAAIRGLEPVLEGSRLSVDGGWTRRPMEPTAASRQLFARAATVAARIGLELGWVRWGGSSDANLTAAEGAPTVDGLGPRGDGAHEPDEHIVTSDLARRLALLADLVGSLAPPPESWLSAEALRDRGRMGSQPASSRGGWTTPM